MTVKETQESLAATMRQWQKVEDSSVASTGKVIEKTDNVIVRMIMEIIQRDSQMHHRIQELIADSLETKTLHLNPDELADVWEMIEHHINLEKKTIQLAEEALDALRGKKMVVQEYLLHYLLEDEQKHNHVLEQLSVIKKGMYPYG
jgi:ferritin-like protein